MKKLSISAKRRILLIFAAFLLLMAGVTVKLGYMQIIKGEEYKELAAEQQTRDQNVAAKRGNIYDRNMKILAQSASCENVMINPRVIREESDKREKARAKAISEGESYDKPNLIDDLVEKLTATLGIDEEFLREEIEKDSASRRIKKMVEQSVANEVRELDLPGVFFEKTTKRYYPYSNFASHVIGFTGDDGYGLEGLEKTLDDTLSGTPGRIQVVQDANNNNTPYEYENYIAPEDGKGVVLTIDEVLQHYTEKYLKEAYNLYDIRNGGAAIMMNPKTGEILAMAVEPNFDLNSPREIDDAMREVILSESVLNSDGTELSDSEKLSLYLNKLWRNKAVVDTYEPGSTFKSIVAASAIEAGAINPDTFSVFCSGAKKVANETIHCHKLAGHGAETFIKAIENSCNPAFMEIGAALGRTRFKEFFEAFGFTGTTGFLLPGESRGVFFSDENFNEVELATSSFGQGFQVTPLQMITAVSAVVNGGNLMKPQLVKAYTDNEGRVIESVEPEVVRKVISEKTSAVMRTALESVVANGTGNGAYVDGYRIGGKTGTSEKFPRGSGKKIASFIGFAPADDPELICLLLLDEPGGNLTGGSAIAAPTVGKILSESLKYLGYEMQYDSAAAEEVMLEVPSLTETEVNAAMSKAKQAGFSVTVKGSGETVINQLPRAASTLKEGGLIILYTQSEDEDEKKTTTVPDFTGMRRSQAQEAARSAGLNLTVSGGGRSADVNEDMLAIRQSLQAGLEVPEGSDVTVDFAYNNND